MSGSDKIIPDKETGSPPIFPVRLEDGTERVGGVFGIVKKSLLVAELLTNPSFTETVISPFPLSFL